MNNRLRFWQAPDEIIARFGQVKLVRKHDGRHELRGGTVLDRIKARLWCLEYAPFVGFDEVPERVEVVVLAA